MFPKPPWATPTGGSRTALRKASTPIFGMPDGLGGPITSVVTAGPPTNPLSTLAPALGGTNWRSSKSNRSRIPG